jgi:hypothetical protein
LEITTWNKFSFFRLRLTAVTALAAAVDELDSVLFFEIPCSRVLLHTFIFFFKCATERQFAPEQGVIL